MGIAPVERLSNAPEGHQATDFMPDCKSVISIGLHIFNEMANVSGGQHIRKKSMDPYLFYGYGLTNL